MTYWGCCTNLATDEELDSHQSMIDGSKSASLATARRAIGTDLVRWAREHGYDRSFPLKNDWHVGHFRSVFLGRRCIYVVWSAFEFIWLEE